MTAEQTVAIISSVGEVVEKTKEPTNYWWLLILAIVPVGLGWWLNRKRKK